MNRAAFVVVALAADTQYPMNPYHVLAAIGIVLTGIGLAILYLTVRLKK